MASLHKLLSEEGFEARKPTKKVTRKKQEVTLPIYICHDRRSFDSSRHQRSRSVAAASSSSSRDVGPSIDDAATKAMVAILTGYVGHYSRDARFRASIRDKCRSCCAEADIMAMPIQCVERLATSRDLDSLQRCINILIGVADTNPNSYIAACAHLYLSIVYKIAKNDKISARTLLQVFCDAPSLARTHLLPELWDHFFLPHLLHLKIWYTNHLREHNNIKQLKHLYHHQMDFGTLQFALYYKDCLKLGAQPPALPTVPLPLKPTTHSSTSHHSSSTKLQLLHQAVFGANSIHFDDQNVWDTHSDDVNHNKPNSHRRSSSLNYQEVWPDTNHKSDYFRFLGCRTDPAECFASKIDRVKVADNDAPSDVAGAIATVCSSESLSACEGAVRAVTKAWLSAEGDARGQLEASLSGAEVIQGILEVLYVSGDDEILELAVSILAEIAAKNEANRRCILACDPQLAVAMRLLRSSSLFLKAAALLYLVKPKAKHMVSMEWIPLVLRVLEFGDQQQTLFTVRCCPLEAAYYFLHELLTGFDEDKNFENAKQIICLGGLSLLVRRMDVGDAPEKSRAASLLRLCIQADGSCRHFLLRNIKGDVIVALLALENSQGSHALALLSELLCVSRRNKRIELLTGLKEGGWKCFNTLHILLLRLQRAHPQERPIIAVILLELDLLGDASECSIYRDDAVDAIIEALDCSVLDEKVQQQAAKALFILGGQFSYTGEEEVEEWLLRKAEIIQNCMNEDEKMREKWQRKAALVLLTSGNRRLLSALSDCVANSIPTLARASLVTICWISSYLHSLGDTDLCVAACTILAPHLMECLIDNTNNLEEKILASFSLYSLTNGTDYLLQQLGVDNNFVGCLQKLSRATWTAKELVSLINNNSPS